MLKGTLEGCILAIISDQETYGYEISQQLQAYGFGKITEGMDVVNKIAEVRTDYMDKPLEAQVMKTVTVETFGVDYPEPETV